MKLNILKTKNKSNQFTSKDVHKLSFRKDKTTNNPKNRILLGEGLIGRIYEGNVVFKDKMGNSYRKKVAIKQFKTPIPEKNVSNYKKVITDLRKIGLEFDSRFPNRNISKSRFLPKMDLVKMKTSRSPKGEWVIVMQGFNKNGKSKLYGNNKFNTNIGKSELNLLIKECAFINVKTIEAGYDPTHLIAQLKDSKALIPIDIDIAANKIGSIFKKPSSRIILENIKSISSLFAKDYKSNLIFIDKLYKYTLEFITDKNIKKEFIKLKYKFDENIKELKN